MKVLFSFLLLFLTSNCFADYMMTSSSDFSGKMFQNEGIVQIEFSNIKEPTENKKIMILFSDLSYEVGEMKFLKLSSKRKFDKPVKTILYKLSTELHKKIQKKKQEKNIVYNPIVKKNVNIAVKPEHLVYGGTSYIFKKHREKVKSESFKFSKIKNIVVKEFYVKIFEKPNESFCHKFSYTGGKRKYICTPKKEIGKYGEFFAVEGTGDQLYPGTKYRFYGEVSTPTLLIGTLIIDNHRYNIIHTKEVPERGEINPIIQPKNDKSPRVYRDDDCCC